MAHRRFEMKNNSWQKFSVRLIFALALSTASLAAQQFIPPQSPITVSQRLVLASGATQREPHPKSPNAAANGSAGITLEELQRRGRAGNPTLGQAKAGVAAATGRTLQAGLWPNPTVGYISEEIRGGSYGGGQHGVFIQQNVLLGSKLGL